MPKCDDIVNATDFRANVSAMFNRAERDPITITRQGAAELTLVSRESWRNAGQTNYWMTKLTAIARYYIAVAKTPKSAADICPSDLPWLAAFDFEDGYELITELSRAVDDATALIRPWDDVEIIFNEWHRSAAYVLDPQLSARLAKAKDVIDRRRFGAK